MENRTQSAGAHEVPSSLITFSLCGDVMTGRGIDQILSHPGDPTLHEPFVRDAGEYVERAETAHGPIARPVDDAYVWGDALEEWNRASPDVRIANLETSITTSNDFWPGKDVHYRMHPRNIGCLAAAQFDCCTLANNHVLDWGHAGLGETLQTLKAAEVKCAGAGMDRQAAAAPVELEIPGKGRAVVFSFGSVTSGIPYSWAATEQRAGVNLLVEMSNDEVGRIQQTVAQVKRAGDIVVASIHWGPNWGYEISEARRKFAHRLIDAAGIDVIHGHSSHHVLGIEVYRDHLILYGCGDFLDDYEGIAGHEEYRGDLGLLYFAGIEPSTGKLDQLRILPTQVRRMRIGRAGAADALWLRDTLNRESNQYGVKFESADEGMLTLKWHRAPAERPSIAAG
jgi:poly-gamma-glutamate capsule biosynthesis protein CapA/YwtB (metallophosphatase superfamily)